MRSDRFTVGNILHRLSRGDDPWAGVRKAARRLPAKRP
jgi:DNA primase